MTTVRLPPEIEHKLQVLSESRHKSKSEIIKEALELFLEQENVEKDSFELGKDYFGRHGSGKKTEIRDYKKEVKEKIRAKHHSR